MSSKLKSGKILYIGPRFHNYEQRIARNISLLGYEVIYYPDFSDDKTYYFLRAIRLTVLFNFYKNYVLNKWLKNILSVGSYDTIFVIKGEGIPLEFWEQVKAKYEPQKCKFIMYQWDSLKNYDYLPLLRFFDDVYTFDYKDATALKDQHPNAHYYPLFFDDQVTRKEKPNIYAYDFAFIGALTHKRQQWLEDFSNHPNTAKYKLFTYLYLPFPMYVYNLIKRTPFNFSSVRFFSISLKKVLSIYKESRVIIDLNNPDQTGLTMRTFEVIGISCKLITTNKNIKNESFYHPDNILIIDMENKDWYSAIEPFMDTPYLVVDAVNNYSLSNWITSIIK